MKFVISILATLISVNVLAEKPTCHPHNGGNYCQYHGKVSRVYVNAGNLILLYFDTRLVKSEAEAQGFNVAYDGAAAVSMTDNRDFANYLYSTLLAAQASGRNVTIQMRGVQNNYLKIDRIWLADE